MKWAVFVLVGGVGPTVTLFETEHEANAWAIEQAKEMNPDDFDDAVTQAELLNRFVDWQYQLMAFDYLHVYPVRDPDDVAAEIAA